MDPPLPFYFVKTREFRRLFSPGKRTLELCDIWAGLPHVRNEWAQALMINSRKTYYKRGKKDLTPLLRLPVEIIYEVFGHLHPIDLYHLFMAAEQLEDLLSTSKVSWLWALVFKRHPEIPSCPMGIQHPSWADLLFGPFTCDECSARRVYPNWLYRRRLCPQCAKRRDYNTMNYRRYEMEEADEDWVYEMDWAEISTLSAIYIRMKTTRENRPDNIHFPLHFQPGEKTNFWWDQPGPRHTADDPQDFADHFVAFLRCGYSGGLEKMREDPSTQFVLLNVVEYHTACEFWAEQMRKIVDSQELQRTQQLVSWAKRKKAFSLYEDQTWSCLFNTMTSWWLMDIDRRHPYRSLRRRWKELAPEILSRLDDFEEGQKNAIEQARLSNRKEDIVDIHTTLHNNTVEQYISQTGETAVPDEAFPSAHELLLYTPFIDVLQAQEPDWEDPSEDTVTDWIMKYRQFLPKWKMKTMKGLAKLSPMIVVPQCMAKYPKLRMNSASAVFYCVGCHAGPQFDTGGEAPTPTKREFFVGWRKAVKHVESGCEFLRLPEPLRVHEQASCASIYALEVLGADPATTEEEDIEWSVEDDDMRLTCLNCPDMFLSSLEMQWEDCIAHIQLFQDDPSHFPPKWRKVRLDSTIERDIMNVFM